MRKGNAFDVERKVFSFRSMDSDATTTLGETPLFPSDSFSSSLFYLKADMPFSAGAVFTVGSS